MILGLLDGFDDVLVHPVVSDGAVVLLDVGVLLRLAGYAAPLDDPIQAP
jgi:hypothetical protein